MKARIAALKKYSESNLKILARDLMGIPYEPQPIEVISARMWERAVKEDIESLCIAMAYLYGCNPVPLCGDAKIMWFCFHATPTQKLICAVAALEAKENKNG